MRPIRRSLAALLVALPCAAQSRDSLLARGEVLIRASNDSTARDVMPGLAWYCGSALGLMKKTCPVYARYVKLNMTGDSLVRLALGMPASSRVDTVTVTKTRVDTVPKIVTVTRVDTVTKTVTVFVHDSVKTDTVKTTAPPPPPPPPGRPNEPAGMAQLSPLLDGTVAPPSTWTALGWVGAGITTATDTVPGYGPTSVLHINYPAGQGNGSAPGRTWTQYSAIFQDWQTPVKTLYVSYWYKVSPNFPLSLNANKMMYGQVNHANSAVIMLNASSDQGTEYTAPMHPRIILQNIKSAAGNPTISQVFDNFSVTIPRGVWFHVEALLVANTAGQADGSAKMFVNGALAVSVPNVAWDVSGAAGLWDTLLWDPVYNLAVPADAIGAYHRLKDLYVSGKP